ncbi:unnamed protein product [Urochloa decumbens]|uniref:Uncharacterized protein n=1 Tax=Urochloa decumbens TaxID=240449 RepID=A0ABC8Z8Q1_9POAL
MEESIGSRVCRGVRSCWMRRRRSYDYQRLPASGRGVRLGRRPVLASTPAWRFGRRLRRRAGAVARWSSPLRLLHRIVDAYVNSLLSQPPLNVLRAAAVEPEPVVAPSPSSTKPRREASPAGSARRRDGGGRGVMLNICVAEALLLRRSTSEVRRSPLQQPPRKAARCTSVPV